MIRLLDRYVWGIFLSALGVFSACFLALAVIVDFAPKLGKFLEPRSVSTAGFILEYYAVRVPLLLAYLLPAVILFAAMFTLIKLSRSNEILPIVAGGTSLRRMSLPFVLTSFMAAAAMAAMDEFVLPRVAERIADTEEILTSKRVSFEVTAYDGRTLVHAKFYDHAQREMTTVRVSHPEEVAWAESCRWDEPRRRWVAYRGHVERPGEWVEVPGGKPVVRKDPIPDGGYALPEGFGPDAVRRSPSFMSRFPSAPLAELLAQARAFPHVPSFRMKVHSRFAFPLSPVILLLMGLPFVAAATQKSFFKGLFLCFLITVAYYLVYFSFLYLGNSGDVPPPLAAWGPAGAFGLAGLISFARMRT